MIDMTYYAKHEGRLVILIFFFLWLFACVAEAMRAPFDFSEGESELVSGFNIEYLGGFFSFIFIAEYSFMLFLSFLTVILFLRINLISLRILLLVFIYIFIRGAYPRLRFDFLMIVM